jgi:large subunit ribosomal protein L32
MGVPKYKKAKARTRSQRSANMKMSLPGMSKCSECGELTPSHRVCIHCGYYKKKLVVEVNED